MGVKMNLRIITKNHESDPELRSRLIQFKALWLRNGHAASVGGNEDSKDYKTDLHYI